jgi:hypothetical protein
VTVEYEAPDAEAMEVAMLDQSWVAMPFAMISALTAWKRKPLGWKS